MRLPRTALVLKAGLPLAVIGALLAANYARPLPTVAATQTMPATRPQPERRPA